MISDDEQNAMMIAMWNSFLGCFIFDRLLISSAESPAGLGLVDGNIIAQIPITLRREIKMEFPNRDTFLQKSKREENQSFLKLRN